MNVSDPMMIRLLRGVGDGRSLWWIMGNGGRDICAGIRKAGQCLPTDNNRVSGDVEEADAMGYERE